MESRARCEAIAFLEVLVNRDSGTHDRLDVNRVGALLARPAFVGENELVFNDLCDAVGQWLKRENRPMRFARPQ